MKKQYIILIILILLLLMLTSCDLEGHDPIGVSFDTLDEFKGNFAEFMAYPSYIPFEFNNFIGSIPFNYGSTTIKYKDLAKEKYKRIDIFIDARFGYYIEDDKVNFSSDELYQLTRFTYVFFPHNKIEQMVIDEKLEAIEYKGYTLYYSEHLYSNVVYTDSVNVEDSNWILLNYYMKFDNKLYKFSFNYDIKLGTSKERFFELRDKLKEEALPEVIKSYKSLKYENND